MNRPGRPRRRGDALDRTFRPIADALAEFRAAGLPFAGALRLAALHATLDASTASLPAFAAACAALGHAPSWAELRALLEAGAALEPRLVGPGERLARAGTPADGLWIVHRGELVARPSGRRGGPMSLFGPGEGYRRGVWLDSIYATRSALLLWLPRREVDALVERCPIAAVGLDLDGEAERGIEHTSTAPPAS